MELENKDEHTIYLYNCQKQKCVRECLKKRNTKIYDTLGNYHNNKKQIKKQNKKL